MAANEWFGVIPFQILVSMVHVIGPSTVRHLITKELAWDSHRFKTKRFFEKSTMKNR